MERPERPSKDRTLSFASTNVGEYSNTLQYQNQINQNVLDYNGSARSNRSGRSARQNVVMNEPRHRTSDDRTSGRPSNRNRRSSFGRRNSIDVMSTDSNATARCRLLPNSRKSSVVYRDQVMSHSNFQEQGEHQNSSFPVQLDGSAGHRLDVSTGCSTSMSKVVMQAVSASKLSMTSSCDE